MRWCTTSDAEQNKCNEFKEVLKKIDNDTTPGCVQATTAVECMNKIDKGQADLITLDGGDIYKAGKSQKLSNRSRRILSSTNHCYTMLGAATTNHQHDLFCVILLWQSSQGIQRGKL